MPKAPEVFQQARLSEASAVKSKPGVGEAEDPGGGVFWASSFLHKHLHREAAAGLFLYHSLHSAKSAMKV